MRTSLLVLLGCCISTVGGPFPFFPGQHPNYDAQVDGSRVETYPGIVDLNRQFPEYTIAYQPPLIGYLSPYNPAQWIIWTTERSPVDFFEQAGLLGEPGPLFPPIDPDDPEEPPPPVGEIPEPASYWMLGLAVMGFFAVRHRRKVGIGRAP
ncbi:hypothetical protein F183_A23790 [Bryobacterales bacterium F-183]|nr:hypothetical protein F183_A23790 [Bryobacterales bacterium F-183]